MGLRETAVADMKRLNQKDWGLPVIFTGPDGVIQDTDAETGDELQAVQILFDTVRVSPETGEQVTVNEPVVVMARSSLDPFPADGEKWLIQFPTDPDATAEKIPYLFSASRASEGGQSLGFARFYPLKAEQSS